MEKLHPMEQMIDYGTKNKFFGINDKFWNRQYFGDNFYIIRHALMSRVQRHQNYRCNIYMKKIT